MQNGEAHRRIVALAPECVVAARNAWRDPAGAAGSDDENEAQD
jgi:hypothetical protein